MMYSDNIIFLDTEFTTLDPAKGELISIGMVKLKTGRELYLELEFDEGTVEPWVKTHVLPSLTGPRISQKDARQKIIRFIGNKKERKEKPYLMAYVNQFDAIYWYKLFGSAKEHPGYWIPIDFASILFAHGYPPNSLGRHSFFKELGIEKGEYKEHNALADARLLREVYVAFLKKREKILTTNQ